jgi:hypothetical protein
MALPDSRDYTAIDGVTQFPAATDQAIQDAIIDIYNRGFGRGTFDNFTGDSVNRGFWEDSPNATFPNDAGAGASGALQLSRTTDGTDTLQTGHLNLNTSGDFWITARIRITSFTGASPFVFFGIENGTDDVGFKRIAGETNWRSAYNAEGSSSDLGVAAGSTYTILEFIRIGSTYTWKIQGTTVLSTSITDVLTDCRVCFSVSRATSGTTTAIADYINFVLLD